MMIEYTKIETVYARDMHGTRKLIRGQFTNKAVEYLKDNEWEWTEKIDGTNIGVVWDGHEVSFQGRTEKTNIPKHLLKRLEEIFCGNAAEEIFEQKFGSRRAILFGEGYGMKIQKVGSLYIPDGVDFILFDVYLPDFDVWLSHDDMTWIAISFGIIAVPVIMKGTISDAVEMVLAKPLSTIGTAPMEGLVGRPTVPIRDAEGKRLIVKIKAVDFE